ncbi:substrate-binding domain-containing protein [Alloyangia pacifica]|uniref:substrate-binding domain-containing protein n=1 Tax=Alloyangia pacifica TaxID=311180 RepID=UPI001CFE9331|nr:substrate-binding domain-containing protein [Alloyangia pacifica]
MPPKLRPRRHSLIRALPAALGLVLAALLVPHQLHAEGRISIIVNDPENPFWAAEGEVASTTAAELGYRAVVTAHEGNALIEGAKVDSAIAAGVDAIILDPADAEGSTASVARAGAAGVPVFVVNSGLARSGLAVAQLLSDNAQGAELGARRWLAEMGEHAAYIELLGAPGDPNAAIRSNAYTAVLGAAPGLSRVAAVAADWSRDQGYEQTRKLLAERPRVTGILAGNDEMALGAVAALKEAGRLDSVTVGGFDGTPEAVAAVLAGELAYTVLQPVARFADEAVRQADHYIRTGTPREHREIQLFDCQLIDREAAARMRAPFVLGE